MRVKSNNDDSQKLETSWEVLTETPRSYVIDYHGTDLAVSKANYSPVSEWRKAEIVSISPSVGSKTRFSMVIKLHNKTLWTIGLLTLLSEEHFRPNLMDGTLVIEYKTSP